MLLLCHECHDEMDLKINELKTEKLLFFLFLEFFQTPTPLNRVYSGQREDRRASVSKPLWTQQHEQSLQNL